MRDARCVLGVELRRAFVRRRRFLGDVVNCMVDRNGRRFDVISREIK